jgi:hypothetical protein
MNGRSQRARFSSEAYQDDYWKPEVQRAFAELVN